MSINLNVIACELLLNVFQYAYIHGRQDRANKMPKIHLDFASLLF